MDSHPRSHNAIAGITVFTCLLILVLFTSTASSQTDSIRNIVDQELLVISSDSAVLQYCIDQARKRRIPIAQEFVLRGINLAQKKGHQKYLADLYTERAILDNRLGQHRLGGLGFLQVDSISQILSDSAKRAGALTNAGLSFYYAGHLDQAMTNYYKAYQLYQVIDQPVGHSRLLNNLAICSKEIDDLHQANMYYKESIRLKKTLADTNGLATTTMNLGLLFGEMDQLDSAVFYLDQSGIFFGQLNQPADQMRASLSKGKVIMDIGNWRDAREPITEAYNYFQRYQPQSEEHILAAQDLAQISMLSSQRNSALGLVEEAIAIARASDKLDVLRELLQQHAQLKFDIGDSRNAYLSLAEASTIKDSLVAEERLSTMEEMRTRFEVDAKEKEIKLLHAQSQLDQAKIRIGRQRLIGISLMLALSLVFVYFLIKLLRTDRKQKEIIQQSLEEKEVLIKEIHHRVKNNLQIISSLLSIQSMQISDESARDAVTDSKNRVKSMSLIHQNLTPQGEVMIINAQEYMTNLVHTLVEAYHAGENKIALNLQVEDIDVDVETMIPLGLILNELITNTMKYAFPEGIGSIDVSFSTSDERAKLTVSDSGIGLPEDFSTNHSLGFTLIQDFSRKLDGHLDIVSGAGTTISLDFPMQKLAS